MRHMQMFTMSMCLHFAGVDGVAAASVAESSSLRRATQVERKRVAYADNACAHACKRKCVCVWAYVIRVSERVRVGARI